MFKSTVPNHWSSLRHRNKTEPVLFHVLSSTWTFPPVTSPAVKQAIFCHLWAPVWVEKKHSVRTDKIIWILINKWLYTVHYNQKYRSSSRQSSNMALISSYFNPKPLSIIINQNTLLLNQLRIRTVIHYSQPIILHKKGAQGDWINIVLIFSLKT